MRYCQVTRLLATCALSLGIALTSQGAIIDLYVLAGQSNAEGRASLNNAPSELAEPYADVSLRFNTGNFGASAEFIALQPQPLGSASQFGPDLTFGRELDAFSEHSVAVVKVTRGGTPLAQASGLDWNPDSENELFDLLLSEIDTATAELTGKGHIVNVRGAAWMQGEADARDPTHASDYEENLLALANALRSRYGSDFRFAIGEINISDAKMLSDYQFAAQVQSGQAAVSETSPLNFFIDTTDLNLLSDGVHFDAESQVLLGKRFAAALVPEPSSGCLVAIGLLCFCRRGNSSRRINS